MGWFKRLVVKERFDRHSRTDLEPRFDFRPHSWKPILDNIEARFDAYLEQENRVNRQKMVDNRVHACLYFIEPTGHSCVYSLDPFFRGRVGRPRAF